MSPLAKEIYRVLVQRVGLTNPLLSYQELVNNLPPLAPPYDNLARPDERLYQALGEVGKFCQERGLPTLTALVIRSVEQTPGSGYYYAFHPEAGSDTAKQREAWERELGRVRSTTYPHSPEENATDGPQPSPEDRPKGRSLGQLRIADKGARANLVFTGHITCVRCSAPVAVSIERNASAVSPKQPAFVVAEGGASVGGRSVGHFFIGTILESPVLYYGSMNHCGTEQRMVVFFNRALRDRADHHLSVMQSLSAKASPSHDEDELILLS